jgi:leucine efflux protein
MFYGVTHLGTFILGTLFIVVLPGPNSLYVLSVASRHGIVAAYHGACGIFVGDTLLMLLAATGAASALDANPALFTTLRYAGAIYLVWLGIGLLRTARTQWRARGAPAVAAASPQIGIPPASAYFRTALLISLLNPKAILFFVSFFIQFVSPTAPHPALAFLILGVIVQFFSVLYLSVLILGGAELAARFRCRQRFAATATGIVGGLFIGFGLRLTGAFFG